MTCTGGDVVLAPRSSIATATSVYVAAPAAAHGTGYGGLVDRPISAPLLLSIRYSTAVTAPSLSLALAVRFTFVPSAKREPSAGELMETLRR